MMGNRSWVLQFVERCGAEAKAQCDARFRDFLETAARAEIVTLSRWLEEWKQEREALLDSVERAGRALG